MMSDGLKMRIPRPLLSRSWLGSSQGVITVGVVISLLLGTLAFVLGTPTHSRLLQLLDGHGWLGNDPKGQVDLANGASGSVDLRLTIPGAAGHSLEVVRSGSTATLVDSEAGTIGTIDLNSYHVTGSTSIGAGPAIDVVASTTLIYVVNIQTGRVETHDPLTNRLVGSVELGSQLTPGVVDSAGDLYLLAKGTGQLLTLSPQHDGHIRRSATSVTVAADQDQLALVNDLPGVLDVTRQEFYLVPGGNPAPGIPVPLSGGVVQLPSVVDGPVIPIAESGSGQLVLVEGGTAHPIAIAGAGSDALGAPEAYAGNIYIPDPTAGKVDVFTNSGAPLPPVVLGHSSSQLGLSLQGGFLWVNDPLNPTSAFSIDTTGVVHKVDKNDPRAVTNVPTTTRPPTPTPTPVPVPVPVPTTQVPTTQPVTPVTVPPTVPSAPGLVTATAGNQSVSVSWAPAGPDGSPVSAYKLALQSAGGGTTVDGFTAGGSDSNHQFTKGILNGTAYQVRVTAVNAVGSGPGVTSNTVTPTSDIPNAPTGVQAADQADGSVTVTWAPANGEGHQITSYSVFAQLQGSTSGSAGGSPPANADQLVAPAVATTQADITTGLVLGSTYEFTVTATNDVAGTSKDSDLSAPVRDGSAPGTVTGLAASSQGKGALALVWSCATRCAGGEQLTDFALAVTPAAASAPSTVPVSPGSTKFSTALTGLSPGTSYTITITPRNSFGPGAPASVTAATHRLPTVAITSAALTGDRQITVTAGASGDTAVTCQIFVQGAGRDGNNCSGSFIESALTGNTNVVVFVRVTDADGQTTDSSSTSVLTNAAPKASTIVAPGAAYGNTWYTHSRPDLTAGTRNGQVHTGNAVTIYCQASGPSSAETQNSTIWDYIGGGKWTTDDAMNNTPAGQFDPSLNQTCPPGI